MNVVENSLGLNGEGRTATNILIVNENDRYDKSSVYSAESRQSKEWLQDGTIIDARLEGL